MPQLGCPHACVYCNQRAVSGAEAAPGEEQLDQEIRQGIRRAGAGLELAFYGGSFTAIHWPVQRMLLETAQPYLRRGELASIRVSTRPDCVEEPALRRLLPYGVKTVELGVQSMDDGVLARSGRGHTAEDSARAAVRVKRMGFSLGLQSMVGLPGAAREESGETARRIAALRPDFVRIYPVLVLRSSPLAQRYRSGRYRPLTLEDAVERSADALAVYRQAGIPVIRIGLQETEGLRGQVLAGPYHPALGEMVYARLWRRKMERMLQPLARDSRVVILPPARLLSQALGQRRDNLYWLRRRFPAMEIVLSPGKGDGWQLHVSGQTCPEK